MTWYCEICGYKILGNRKSFGELCGFCHEAYLRGREDAAKAVEAVAEPFFLTRFNPIDEDDWAVFVNMLAAAREDGTDEDKLECWQCGSCADPDCGCIGCGIARGDGAE